MVGLIEQFGLLALFVYGILFIIKEIRISRTDLNDLKTEIKTSRVEQLKTNEFIIHRVDSVESETKELKSEVKELKSLMQRN